MRYTLISRIRLFIGLAALLFMNIVSAQQNQKTVFPQPQGYIYSEAGQIVNTPDGGWLLTGFSSSSDQFNNSPRLIKLNSDGLTEWDNTYLPPTPPHGSRFTPRAVLNSPDGGWLVSLQDDSTNIHLMHVGAGGNLVWTKDQPFNQPDITLRGVSNNNTYYASSQNQPLVVFSGSSMKLA